MWRVVIFSSFQNERERNSSTRAPAIGLAGRVPSLHVHWPLSSKRTSAWALPGTAQSATDTTRQANSLIERMA